MHPVLAVVLAIGGIVIGALVFGSKNATLSKLEPVPGETLVVELDSLTVTTRSTGGNSHAPNSLVRVTDRRIIVAQRALLSDDPLLLYVFTLLDAGQGTLVELGTTLKKGHSSCAIGPDQIELSEDQQTIRITLGGGAIAGARTVEIPVTQLGPWREAGLIQSAV